MSVYDLTTDDSDLAGFEIDTQRDKLEYTALKSSPTPLSVLVQQEPTQKKGESYYCAQCRNFTVSSLTTRLSVSRYILHKTFAEFQKSARKGCVLCTFLMETLLARGDQKLDSARNSPVILETALDVEGHFSDLVLNIPDIREPLELFQLRDTANIDPRVTKLDIAHKSDLMVVQWACDQIANCNSKERHHSCHQSYRQDSHVPGSNPTRLLDLQFDSGSKDIRVVEGIQDQPYVALSHCWGGESPLKLTKATLGDFCARLCFLRLPRSFQDAVTICRMLGYRYLWIDTFCIIQDDESDWLSESTKMANLYRNSDLTLAFSAAENCHQPILRPRVSPKHIQLAGDSYHIHIRSARDIELQNHWKGGGGDRRWAPRGNMEACTRLFSPLGHRAWAYQERFMAQRVLHISVSELAWECKSSNMVESSSQAQHGGDLSLARMKSAEEFLKSWPHAVAEYSRRKLTYQKDRLIAFSAIVEAFAPHIDCAYWAGMWEKHMNAQLMWKPARSSRDLTRKVSAGEYVAPSWSWASHAGGVYYETKELNPHERDLVILSCAIKLQTQSCFAGILSARLSVRGACVAISKQGNFEKPVRGWRKPKLEGALRLVTSLPGSFDMSEGGTDTPFQDRTLSLLQVCKSWSFRALIIEHVHGEDETVYRRVGVSHYDEAPGIEWQWRDLILV